MVHLGVLAPNVGVSINWGSFLEGVLIVRALRFGDYRIVFEFLWDFVSGLRIGVYWAQYRGHKGYEVDLLSQLNIQVGGLNNFQYGGPIFLAELSDHMPQIHLYLWWVFVGIAVFMASPNKGVTVLFCGISG